MKQEFTLTLSLRRQKLGWVYLLFELLLLPSILFALGDALGITSHSLLNGIYYGINFFVCLPLFWQILSPSFRRFIHSPLPILATAAAGYLVLRLCDLGLAALMGYLDPGFSNVNDAAVGDLIRQSPNLMLICVGFLVPAAEECLFRGLLFVPLYPRRPAAAYGLSVLVFAAIHVMGYVGVYPLPTLALCFVQYLPAGLILCLSLAKTDSLVTPILIHCAVNLTGFLTLR